MRLVSLMLLCAPLLCAQVVIRQGNSRVSIEIDGRPYTEFAYGTEVTKPYLDPLRAATGLVVTRRYPMQTGLGETADHMEHRGVWFGHSDINGFNFYANEKSFTTPNRGTIVVRKIDAIQSGKKSGSVSATLAWLDPSGKELLVEKRRMVFYSDKTQRLIDFDFTLIPTVTVRIGDHRDGLFSIRVADYLQEPSKKLPSIPPRTGVMASADGCTTETNCWGKASNWMDYSGEFQGEKVGIAILDHPDNPHHPTHWQARGYGLFAANIVGLHEFTHGQVPDGGITRKPGQSLRFRYRVIIHPGDANSANIAAAYSHYAAKRK